MLGTQDLLIGLALVAFFFGAKRLSELARSLGQSMTEFKKAGAPGLRRGVAARHRRYVPRGRDHGALEAWGVWKSPPWSRSPHSGERPRRIAEAVLSAVRARAGH